MLEVNSNGMKNVSKCLGRNHVSKLNQQQYLAVLHSGYNDLCVRVEGLEERLRESWEIHVRTQLGIDSMTTINAIRFFTGKNK